MNLALLNPFRQADRIDSTLTIPRALHPPRPKKDNTTSDTTTASNDDATTPAKNDEANPALSPSDAFKIPKKQKLNGNGNVSTNSTKLFRQSLKLPKLLSNGNAESTNSNSRAGDTTSSSSSNSPVKPKEGESTNTSTGSVNRIVDAADEANKHIMEDDDKDSMMDVEMKGSSETMSNADKDIKFQHSKERSDNEVTPKKKKRKKKGQKKPPATTAKDTSSEEEDDDDDGSENYWTACYAVSFNRRGSCLASGHASGLIPIHDFLGRTMSALYWPPPGINLAKGENNASAVLLQRNDTNGGGKQLFDKEIIGKKKKSKQKKKRDSKGGTKQDEKSLQISSNGDLLVGAASKDDSTVDAATATSGRDDSKDEGSSHNQLQYMNGVTSLSWCRHSRTILAGAIGDKNLRLMDNTHPLVSTDCTEAVRRQFLVESGNKDVTCDETPFTLEGKMISRIISMPPPAQGLGELSESSSVPKSPSDEMNPGEKITIHMETVSLGRARLLRSNIVDMKKSKSSSSDISPSSAFLFNGSQSASMAPPQVGKITINALTRRHPTLLLELPQPLGGPVQLHPRDSHAGLACMIDGSLALFWMPPMAFYETLHSSVGLGNEADSASNKTDENDDERKKKQVMNLLKEEELSRVGNLSFLVLPPGNKPPTANQSNHQYFITCAAFGKQGDVIWAVTKCGNLLAFCIDSSMMRRLRGCNDSPVAAAFVNQMVNPTLCVKVPGGAAAWQIIVSRNGKSLLLNSADCSLRLYDVGELSEAFKTPSGEVEGKDNIQTNDVDTRNADIAPRFVFQDNISKAPWASCDFSGDGEYVCGGSNSYPQPGDNYKLFLWNCITGELVDQLTGPVGSLYSLSCHPTRPFIAVGTSDGLVDVWGARLDWVAFAPDFQALQQNELYEEREDEFDAVDDGEGGEEDYGKGGSLHSRLSPENDDVDIVTIDQVPAFDSDSEDESEVFYFDTKVAKILSEKQPGPKKAEHE